MLNISVISRRLVNIGSDNGLAPLDDKPLPGIYGAIWRHWTTDHNELRKCCTLNIALCGITIANFHGPRSLMMWWVWFGKSEVSDFYVSWKYIIMLSRRLYLVCFVDLNKLNTCPRSCWFTPCPRDLSPRWHDFVWSGQVDVKVRRSSLLSSETGMLRYSPPEFVAKSKTAQ